MRAYRTLRRLPVQSALLVLCGITAQAADSRGVPDIRDVYLILSGCWAALSALDLTRLLGSAGSASPFRDARTAVRRG